MQVTCMIQIKIKDALQSDVYLNCFRFYFIVLRVHLSHVWPIVNLYFSQTSCSVPVPALLFNPVLFNKDLKTFKPFKPPKQ